MAATFPAVWLIILVSTQLRPDTGLTARARQIRKPLAIDSAQNAALKRLMQAIESDLVYLDATLTIPELSKRCGVTEYQMRNLINGHLGFANFSAFLNAYRIEEAKRRLTLSDDAITSIALDCGFQTLSTFNRAFQKIEGQTPTNYRQSASKFEHLGPFIEIAVRFAEFAERRFRPSERLDASHGKGTQNEVSHKAYIGTHRHSCRPFDIRGVCAHTSAPCCANFRKPHHCKRHTV